MVVSPVPPALCAETRRVAIATDDERMERRPMDIGRIVREIEVEPLDEPIVAPDRETFVEPGGEPTPVPEPEPPVREPVPA